MAQLKGTFPMSREQRSIQLTYTGIIIALILLASVGIYNNDNCNNNIVKTSRMGKTSLNSLATVTSANSNFNKISEYKMYEETVKISDYSIRNVDNKIHYNLNNKLQLRDEGETKADTEKTIRTFNDGDKYEFVKKHNDDDNDHDDDDIDYNSYNNRYVTNNSAKYLKLKKYNDAINKSNQSIASETTKINLNNSLTIVKTYSRAESSLSSLIERDEKLQESYSSTDKIRDLVLLHRRKRYLLFPESSSFQMIFDLIIGVVDYTKFAILGITCAIAWELPSKPPSEIIEDVRQKLFNGTLGLQRRNDTVIETDFNTMNNPFPELAYNDNHNNRYYSYDNKESLPKNDYYYINTGKPAQSFNDNYKPQESNYKYKNNNYNNNFQQYGPSIYGNSYNKAPLAPANNGYDYKNSRVENTDYNRWSSSGVNNWWSRNQDRVQQQWQQQQQKWQKYNTNTIPPRSPTYGYRPTSSKIPIYDLARNVPQHNRDYGRRGRARKILTKPPKHRIYSIYGKRRRRREVNNDTDLKLDAIHLSEHLRSRNKLFRKIEKVFKTAGHNGTACVLRALCETSYKNRQKRSVPQDFIQEILRAIFTLPQKEGVIAENVIGQHYLDAYARNGECSQQQYNDCSHSIWHDNSL